MIHVHVYSGRHSLRGGERMDARLEAIWGTDERGGRNEAGAPGHDDGSVDKRYLIRFDAAPASESNVR